jgi:hypothetical protein
VINSAQVIQLEVSVLTSSRATLLSMPYKPEEIVAKLYVASAVDVIFTPSGEP